MRAFAVATAVSKCSLDMEARDCQREDWVLVIPMSCSVAGRVASCDSTCLLRGPVAGKRSPLSAESRSNSPALRSARTLISVAH